MYDLTEVGFLNGLLNGLFFHGSQRFVCWLILISSVSIFILILKSSFLNI